MTKGYCMHCRKKVEMQNVVSKKTKRGTVLNKGKCPKCGTIVCCISKGE